MTRNRKAIKVLNKYRDAYAKGDTDFETRMSFVSTISNYFEKDSMERNMLSKVLEDETKTVTYIDGLIETIKNTGVKGGSHNFLCNYSNSEIIATISIISPIIIGLTIYFNSLLYKIEIHDLNQKLELTTDSLFSIQKISKTHPQAKNIDSSQEKKNISMH
jgi:hypothetical protein